MAGQARTTGMSWDSSKFRKALEREIKQIPEATDRELQLVAIDISNRAKQLAPVRTGFLRSRIGWRKIGVGRYRVFALAPYSPPVEFGHHTASGSFVPPQPFMRPAWAEAIYHFTRHFRITGRR